MNALLPHIPCRILKVDAEIWKEIAGYEGLYEVSSLGKVRTVDRYFINKRGYKEHVIPSELKHQNKVYPFVGLWKSGKMKTRSVHRLVAIAFIPNPENKRCVNHKDGNKYNFSLSNLEWATSGENISHAFRTGLRSAAMKGKRLVPAVHGSRNEYKQYKCRCELCVTNMNVRRKEERLRRKARLQTSKSNSI